MAHSERVELECSEEVQLALSRKCGYVRNSVQDQTELAEVMLQAVVRMCDLVDSPLVRHIPLSGVFVERLGCSTAQSVADIVRELVFVVCICIGLVDPVGS